MVYQNGMRRSLVGSRVSRVEDERFIRGKGAYVADLTLPGMLHAVIARSIMASARLNALDVSRARALPGVIAVLTGQDLLREDVGGIPWEVCPPKPDGSSYGDGYEQGDARIAAPQPLLAIDQVRYVGEGIAIVVAESLAIARDAAEQIEIDYDALPAAIDMTQATQGGEAVWPGYPDNVCFRIRMGDATGTEAAFASAAHRATVKFVNNRLSPNAIEPRGYLGVYDSLSAAWTLHASAGKPHAVRDTLARFVLKVAPERIQVLVPDIGGGFGSKNVVYPEEGLVLWAAKAVGRPVRWISDRAEAMMTDMAGRDQVGTAELALDSKGRILALRERILANLGAYLAPRGVVSPRNTIKMSQGLYHVPVADVEVRGVFTHTTPTCPYRGAGQPEALFIIERLLDEAAFRFGFDRVALRRLNLITPEALPYRTLSGLLFDSGTFEANMEAALLRADWKGFQKRARASARQGFRRGIGLVNMIEACGHGYDETATVAVHPDGMIEILIGTQSSGQSHVTVYSQILSDALSVDLDRIRVIQGDTMRIATGNGTGASRSLSVGGSAVRLAAERLIEVGRGKAAERLDADPNMVEYGEGFFRVAGTNRTVVLAELTDGDLPFVVRGCFAPDNYTFPNGCHVAEVEVDPGTGRVDLVNYTLVQDVGCAVNPMVVEGQLHGGLAQGFGQALVEHAIFDSAGQLLTGSFMDYGMPRAHLMPPLDLTLVEVPTNSNPLGVKAVGEAGPTAAPPAVVNAVLHALASLGVRHIDMPLTPARVWEAIAAAKANGDAGR